MNDNATNISDWLQPGKLNRVVCRPALPKDTPDVMELTRTIWDGGDYIPYVWEEWLADDQGLLAVAEYGGRVVGIGKLTRVGELEWWMEGMRVHPEYEGRGIARRMHEYLLERWEWLGGGTVRLATGSFREPIKHLCGQTGFRQVADLTFYSASLAGEAGGSFLPLASGEAEEAIRFAFASETLGFPTGIRIMDLGWQWATLTVQSLEEARQREGAWWWLPDGRRRGMVVARPDEDEGVNLFSLQLVACTLDDLPALLQDCCKLAVRPGFERVTWLAPLHPQITAIMEMAGFRRDWDQSLYIYEKEHVENEPPF